MPLTRDFKETIKQRARRDAGFREALLKEAVDALLSGDLDSGKIVLRDYINATVGFDKLGNATKRSPKSLMRMLGPKEKPQARNFFEIVAYLQKRRTTARSARCLKPSSCSGLPGILLADASTFREFSKRGSSPSRARSRATKTSFSRPRPRTTLAPSHAHEHGVSRHPNPLMAHASCVVAAYRRPIWTAATVVIYYEPKLRTVFARAFMTKLSVVHSDPEILGGTPVFRGTRVPLRNLFDYLERGHDIDEFLDAFPSVSREQAIAVLETAHEALTADTRSAR